ncbi:14952_t:CDS:1, partial [Racocetra persica]
INNELHANKICYSNFEEAINHSKQRIHKIDDTRNIIDTGPSLPCSYSFYDLLNSDNFDLGTYNQESTSDSNMVVEESSDKNL